MSIPWRATLDTINLEGSVCVCVCVCVCVQNTHRQGLVECCGLCLQIGMLGWVNEPLVFNWP